MELKNYIVPSVLSHLTKENHILASRLIEEINMHSGAEAYHALFDMEPRDDFKAYEGLHYPASGWVIIDIDFDYKLENGKYDVAKNIEAAGSVVLNIWKSLKLSEDFARIFFSGSKGFHVYIRAEYFGVTEASTDCSKHLKRIITALSKEFNFKFDTSVYHANRKFRLPSSVNPKSGLYKTELTIKQINSLKPKGIIELAEKPSISSIDMYRVPTERYKEEAVVEAKKIIESNEAVVFGGEIITDDTSFSNTIKNKPCIEKIISSPLEVGERHNAALAVIRDSVDSGLTKDEAVDRILNFMSSKKLTKEEAKNRTRQYLKNVDEAYSGKFDYKFGCYEGVKHENCSGKCPLYKKLDVNKRAVVNDEPKEVQTQKDVIVKEIKSGARPVFPDVKETQKTYTVLNTFENFLAVCDFIGITAKYNIIKKKVELIIPGQEFHPDNEDNNKLNSVQTFMNRYLMPSQNADEYINRYADRYQYNPVAQWVLSEKWDGVSRFDDLLNTVKTNPANDKIKKIIFKRWLISCVASAFEPKGFFASGVLVFVGKQYAGKTNWIKKLAPPELEVIKTGLSLNTEDKDSVAKAVSSWICELGELDATFGKSNISRIKAFITNDVDEFRPPYARKSVKFQRRTIFYGSVNPTEFLNDPTGNRRFWPIETDEVDHSHSINVQQLWAEVYEKWYMNREEWWLLPEEFDLLNEHNEQFTAEEPWFVRISKLADFDPTNGITSSGYVNELSSTELAMACGVRNPTKSDTTKIGAAAAKLGWACKRKKNVRLWVFKSTNMVSLSWDDL